MNKPAKIFLLSLPTTEAMYIELFCDVYTSSTLLCGQLKRCRVLLSVGPNIAGDRAHKHEQQWRASSRARGAAGLARVNPRDRFVYAGLQRGLRQSVKQANPAG
jgi:hypothetical protein